MSVISRPKNDPLRVSTGHPRALPSLCVSVSGSWARRLFFRAVGAHDADHNGRTRLVGHTSSIR